MHKQLELVGRLGGLVCGAKVVGSTGAFAFAQLLDASIERGVLCGLRGLDSFRAGGVHQGGLACGAEVARPEGCYRGVCTSTQGCTSGHQGCCVLRMSQWSR